MEVLMKVGKDLSIDEEFTVHELKKYGWTHVEFKFELTDQMIEWMVENFCEVTSQVRWWNTHICFRKQEDAFKFKLRWL